MENGFTTREDVATRHNGSEFAQNAGKLTIENEQLRKANGGGTAAKATEPPPDEGGEETGTEDDDADPDEE